MHGHDVTMIALSRTKILVLLGIAIGFVALGAWMLSIDESDLARGGMFSSPWVVRSIAIASIGFFGLMGLAVARKLLDPRPGLVLSSTGLTDNASALSAGFVPWADVEAAQAISIHSQRTLVIRVRHPERYIERGSALRRAINRTNSGMIGSPIAIPASALKLSFDELLALVERYLGQYGSGSAGR